MRDELLKKYVLAEKISAKLEMQGYYEVILFKKFHRPAKFCSVSEIPRINSRNTSVDRLGQHSTPNCIYVISRQSKAKDFLEFLYTFYNGKSILDKTIDTERLLRGIPFNRKVIEVVMYKLGIVSKTGQLDNLRYFTDRDLIELKKLENDIGLR